MKCKQWFWPLYCRGDKKCSRFGFCVLIVAMWGKVGGAKEETHLIGSSLEKSICRCKNKPSSHLELSCIFERLQRGIQLKT